MVKELRIAKLPAAHGRYIYAYCNVQTNQVLYSLERTLRNTHLNQLADAGANNNPPKLRKDVWRPLFTVALPDTRDGRSQGINLFKQLREYRLLHETTWELPEEIKRPYTEKEIEALQKKLDDRGGSKKETVYDIIKREKFKMRAKMVMNQKANSVADLAAILLRQAEKGVKSVADREETRQRDVELIAKLAEQHEDDGLAKLAQTVKQLHAEVRENQEKSKNKEHKRKERKAFLEQSERALQGVRDTKLRMKRMEWSANVVRNVRHWIKMLSDNQRLEEAIKNMEARKAEAEEKSDDTALPSEDRQAAYQEALGMERIINSANWYIKKTQWVGLLPSDAESRARTVAPLSPRILEGWSEPKAAKDAATEHDEDSTNAVIDAYLAGQHASGSEATMSPAELESATADIAQLLPEPLAGRETVATEKAQLADCHEYLPELPPRAVFIQAAKGGYLPSLDKTKEVKALKPLFKIDPTFTADGVTVKWSNILDAEYAEFWPEGVSHEPLGFAKYTAPKPDAKPKERHTSSYLENEDAGVDEAAEPVASGDGVVDAGAAAEDRQGVLDRIKKTLLDRTNAKARAPVKRYPVLDKRWAARDAKKLREARQVLPHYREPTAQESAPSL